MKKLTPIQIQAGDEILKECESNGTASPFRLFGRSNVNKWGWEIDDITNAGDFLMSVKVIKSVSDRVKEGGVEYMFTNEGEQSYSKGKRTFDYVNEEFEKVNKQQLKDQLDHEIKLLQRQDLHDRVTKLNPAQYQSFSDLWKRHWMIVAVPLVGVLIALLTFIFKK